MVKKNKQGRRTDREKKPWGTTRKVSREGRITLPSTSENGEETFEVVRTSGGFAGVASGAIVASGEYIQNWKNVKDLAEERLNSLKSKKKSSS